MCVYIGEMNIWFQTRYLSIKASTWIQKRVTSLKKIDYSSCWSVIRRFIRRSVLCVWLTDDTEGFLELTCYNTSSSSPPCWTADGGETPPELWVCHIASCVNTCTLRALDSHYPASCWRLVKDSVAAESSAADEPDAVCVRHLLPDSSWEWNADCLTKLSVNVCI